MAAPPVARPDRIRRHNLSLMLRHIHIDGALTRAELTARMQVSRSTVGSLVGDLTALGLVEETVPSGGSRVGRPSHVVVPAPGGPWVAAVDVDVNKVVTAGVGIGGQVLARTEHGIDPARFTPQDMATLIRDEVRAVACWVGRAGLPVAIGVSVPGTVDLGSGRIGVAPNLGWHDVDLHDLLGAGDADDVVNRVPLVVGNDADLAVLAEHSRGQARHCENVVFIQGRVGIGSGIIIGGRPVRGHLGHAGEIGHIVLDADGPACHCGKTGCVETFIGADALLRLADLGQGNVDAVFAHASMQGEDADSARARAATHRVADSLGETIAIVVNLLNPQRVVLGGHLAALFELAAADVEKSLTRFALEAADRTVQLTVPSLGAEAALLGAAEVAFAAILADPYGALASA